MKEVRHPAANVRPRVCLLLVRNDVPNKIEGDAHTTPGLLSYKGTTYPFPHSAMGFATIWCMGVLGLLIVRYVYVVAILPIV